MEVDVGKFHTEAWNVGGAGMKSLRTGYENAGDCVGERHESCNFDVLLSSSDPEVECAIQFRRIGDKLNFRQKLLNLISKLFRSGT
ncbi:hypothetical protein E2I00_001069 [Balaenoptera physalus]|uniref:Uncharacterized protein n=1 Tax=Balaenoptera physalus TaxID=9770 RepID=A0A6A1QKJ0_BALPH|nr:hypothetical protein E2I00_001069 [Balaenoptera physalus]